MVLEDSFVATIAAAGRSDPRHAHRIGTPVSGWTEEVKFAAFEPFFPPPGARQGHGIGLATIYGNRENGGLDLGLQRDRPGHTSRSIFPSTNEPRSVVRPLPEPSNWTAPKRFGRRGSGGRAGVVRQSLNRHGYEVLTAATPSEAQRLASGAEAGSAGDRCGVCGDERPRPRAHASRGPRPACGSSTCPGTPTTT